MTNSEKFDSLHFCSFNPNEDPKRRMALHNHLKKLRKELAIRWVKRFEALYILKKGVK